MSLKHGCGIAVGLGDGADNLVQFHKWHVKALQRPWRLLLLIGRGLWQRHYPPRGKNCRAKTPPRRIIAAASHNNLGVRGAMNGNRLAIVGRNNP